MGGGDSLGHALSAQVAPYSNFPAEPHPSWEGRYLVYSSGGLYTSASSGDRQ
jgi:hypothetical protein